MNKRNNFKVCFVMSALLVVFMPAARSQEPLEKTMLEADFEPIANEDCLACHDTMNADTFAASIHGSNRCTSCHTEIKEIPHPEKLKPVQCADCHAIESRIYYESDHGKAVHKGVPAAACLDCHGEPHALLNYRNPASTVHRSNIPKTCGTCHEDSEKMSQYGLSQTQALTSYEHSIHGEAFTQRNEIQAAVCTDCHGSHDLHGPSNPDSKIYWKQVPQTCGKCHENVLQTYSRSIHGKAVRDGKREAPVCTDCHGEHNILGRMDPESSVFGANISEKTCGHCHAAERIITKYRLPPFAVQSYMESYHGLASKFGLATVANCASCHGAHDILPSSDVSSSVHKSNLPQTCGRCHPGVSDQLAMGTVHVIPSSRENSIVYYVTWAYIGLIWFVIGLMVLHNLRDFIFKLKRHRRQHEKHSRYVRFTRGERMQHAMLTFSFVVLAYSGFALRFPESWWAYPFFMFGTQMDWRGNVHRAAAVIFSVLSVYHLFFLVFTRRGHGELKAFFPRQKDFQDFAAMQRYYGGKQPHKPIFGRYNYIEKLEYWALLWGALIMIATGAMLTFENVIMRHLPKWALDVATAVHFYEAVLATLAILVWHFYFVIFDPDVYPLNLSMKTGRITEEEARSDDPLQEEDKGDKPT